MSESDKTRKAHCPTCDGERTCDIHGHVYKAWDWEDRYGHSAYGGVDHTLLECRGCEAVFYETSSWNSEDIDPYHDAFGQLHMAQVRDVVTHPRPDTKTKPVWFDGLSKVDAQLHRILAQMYVAQDNEANILVAVALRTALDRATEVLGIDPAMTFDQKLNELHSGGWIGQTERDVLGVVTDAGNAAAHRGWEPAQAEIIGLISSMEVFLHRAFIVGNKALGIVKSIPPRQKRLAAPRRTP